MTRAKPLEKKKIEAKDRPKVCAGCGTKMVNLSQPAKRFCSYACRMRFHQELRRECFLCGVKGRGHHPHYDKAIPPTLRGSEGNVLLCDECHTAVSTRRYHQGGDLLATMDAVRRDLIAEHKLFDPAIYWSPDELNELSGPLMRHILSKQRQQAVARRRAEHMGTRLAQIDHLLT